MFAMSPVSSTLEPIYLKCYTLCSSSPNQLSSLAIIMSKIKSMNWVFGLLILIPLSSNAFLQVSKYSVLSVSSSPHSTMSSANIIDPGMFFLTSSVNTSIRSKNMYNQNTQKLNEYNYYLKEKYCQNVYKKTTFETLVCKSLGLQNTFQSHIISNDSGY